jgi:hypothetical protein
MWISFGQIRIPGRRGATWPCAIKISAGKVSAITGKKWKDGLHKKDYCVAPDQKWLDGFVVENGKIKQFVATPLGSGASAEEQITGKAEFGGLQIEVFPMKLEAFERRFPKGPDHSRVLRGMSLGGGGGHTFGFAGGSNVMPGVYSNSTVNEIHDGVAVAEESSLRCDSDDSGPPKKGIEVWEGRPGVPDSRGEKSRSFRGRGRKRRTTYDPRKAGKEGQGLLRKKAPVQDMAMGAGGSMVQQVFEDPYGIEDWDLEHGSRCFVHLCSSTAWRQVTGAEPPTVPLTPAEYVANNVPWFHLWDDEAKALKGTKKLAGLKTVKEVGKEKGVPMVTEDASVTPEHVVPLSKDAVRNGEW